MTILLAPVASGEAQTITPELFRKQVLRKGKFGYKGRELDFNEDYLNNLVKSFRQRAYDTVPFVLADEKNRHTMEPERANGEVVGLEATPSGLDMIVRLSRTAAKIVQDNPRFGVSARIVEGLERGDGYRAPAAIQHVLGTWDPRMTGMSPWTAVEMSADDDDHEVIDLTSGGDAVPLSKADREKRLDALLGLPEDRFAALIGEVEPKDQGAVGPYGLTEKEAEDILADLDGETEEDTETGEPEGRTARVVPAGAALANDDDQAIELAQLRESHNGVLAELGRERWKRERDRLLGLGVPPAMLDLAEPVLSRHEPLELSTGEETLDVAKVVRALLDEARGTIDMSGELGHGGEIDMDETDRLHKLADAQGVL